MKLFKAIASVLLALTFGLGCSTYTTAKTWADTVCDVVHALPAASTSRLSPGATVVIVANSSSVQAKTISSAPADLHPDINVGY